MARLEEGQEAVSNHYYTDEETFRLVMSGEMMKVRKCPVKVRLQSRNQSEFLSKRFGKRMAAFSCSTQWRWAGTSC